MDAAIKNYEEETGYESEKGTLILFLAEPHTAIGMGDEPYGSFNFSSFPHYLVSVTRVSGNLILDGALSSVCILLGFLSFFILFFIFFFKSL